MRISVLAFILFVLSIFGLHGQGITKLKKSLDTTQSIISKRDILVKLADEHLKKEELKSAIEYSIQATILNKSVKEKPKRIKLLYMKQLNEKLWHDIGKRVSSNQMSSTIDSLDQQYLIPDLYNNIANEYRWTDITFSKKYVQKALALSQQNKDAQQEGIAYYLMAETNRNDKILENREANYSQSLTIFSALKDTFYLIKNISELGMVSLRGYNLKKAELLLKKAWELSKIYKEERLLLNCLTYLGHLNHLKGDFSKRCDYINQALNITLNNYEQDSTLSNEYMVAIAKWNLGRGLCDNGQYKEALPLLKPIFELNLSINHGYGLSENYRGLAACYKDLGIYDTAITYYYKSINYAKEFKQEYISKYRQLGSLYFEIGDKETALNVCEEVNQFYVGFDFTTNKKEKSIYYYWKAKVFQELEQADSALYYQKKELTVLKEGNIMFSVPPAQIRLGKIYQEQGDWVNAKKQFNEAIAIAEDIGLIRSKCEAIYHLAVCKQRTQNYKLANEYALRSLQLASDITYKAFVQKIYALLADVNSQLGQYEAAYTYQSLFTNLKDSTLGVEQIAKIAKIETDFQMKEKQLENEKLQLEQERQAAEIRERGIGLFLLSLLVLLLIALSILYNQKSKLAAQKKLRMEITKDVHDDLGGIIVNLKRTAKEALENQTNNNSKKLTNIIGLANQVRDNLKDIIWKTEASPKPFIDIEQEIRAFITLNLANHTIPYTLTINGFDHNKTMPFKQYYHFAKIYKEALQNILKHGTKDTVTINLEYRDNNVFLRIENRFSLVEAPENTSISLQNGIRNMKERALLMKGSIEIGKRENRFMVILKFKLKN